MELKSIAVRGFTNVTASITGTAVFWLLVAVGLVAAAVLGALVLWPFKETMEGMSVAMLNGQFVMAFLFSAMLYLISSCHKEFGVLGVVAGLLILTMVVLAVDLDTYSPGLKHWIADNCTTFPWFGTLIAILLGVFSWVSYYGLKLSGIVFDYVRNKIGAYENVVSQFDDSADKNKKLRRLLMLWMFVSVCLLTAYCFISVKFDPSLAQSANEISKKIEEQKIERELSEHFPQKIPALVGDQQ